MPEKTSSHLFFRLKKDRAKKYPNRPEVKTCRKVPVINLSQLPAKRFIELKGQSIKIFSEAAKPKAAIIIYIIISTGSSNSGAEITFILTTKYLAISSGKAVPKKQIIIKGKVEDSKMLPSPIPIRATGTATAIPQRKTFIIILFDSGWISFLKKNKSHIKLGAMPKIIKRG